MDEFDKVSFEQRRALTTLIRYRLDLAKEYAKEDSYSQSAYVSIVGLTSTQLTDLLRAKGVQGYKEVAKQVKIDLIRWREAGLVDHYINEPFEIVFGKPLFEESQHSETYEQYLSRKVELSRRVLNNISNDYEGTYTIFRYANQTKYGKKDDNTVYVVNSELHIGAIIGDTSVLPFDYEFHSEHSGNKPYEVAGFVLPTLTHLHFHGFSHDPFSPVLFTLRREKKPISRLNGLLTRKHFSAVPFSSRIVVVKHDENNHVAFRKLPPRFDERVLFPVEGEKNPVPRRMTEEDLKQIRVDIKREFMLNATNNGKIPLKMV